MEAPKKRDVEPSEMIVSPKDVRVPEAANSNEFGAERPKEPARDVFRWKVTNEAARRAKAFAPAPEKPVKEMPSEEGATKHMEAIQTLATESRAESEQLAKEHLDAMRDKDRLMGTATKAHLRGDQAAYDAAIDELQNGPRQPAKQGFFQRLINRFRS